MSFLDNLALGLLPQPIRSDVLAGRQVKAAARSERVGVQGRLEYPDTELVNLTRAYSRNEIVYAALKARADACNDLKIRVQGRSSSRAEWGIVEGHPLHRLLIRPNDRMDGAQFLRTLVFSWEVTRRVYVEKLYANANTRTGALVGLNILDPLKVTKQRDGTYLWRDGTQRVIFQPDELLVREPGLFDPSPVAVCLGSVDGDSAQTDYIRSFFNNGGVPNGVLTSDQPLTPEQADEIRGRWRALFGRFTGRQHDIAVLGRGSSYTRMGANLDELQGDSLREFTESRVCMVFKVPPLIIYAYAGLRRATYSNLKEAWASYWDTTLMHQFKDWLSWLTWSLLTEFEDQERIYSERVRLYLDLSDVKALQEDEDAKHKRAEMAFRAGGLLLNEYRELIGEAPDPAGDYYVRPISVMTVPYGAVPIDVTPPSDPETRAAFRQFATKALKAASTQTIESRMEREMERLLAAVYTRVADAVREQARN